jgi:hypothetical protein
MHVARLLLTASAVILCPFAALADTTTTYDYTGANFTTTVGAYTTSDSVQGSITFSAPLADNLADYAVFPESFSFTDGVQTITSSTPGVSDAFAFSTDASGNIDFWTFFVQSSAESYIFSVDGAVDEGTSDPNDAGYSSAPGSWTEASPVPEPSTLALLGSGALGLIAPIRRRLRA